MPRIVRGGLIQATLSEPGTAPIEKIKKSMTDKHVGLIEQAAKKGAQVVCLQELFYGPYFCAEQNERECREDPGHGTASRPRLTMARHGLAMPSTC